MHYALRIKNYALSIMHYELCIYELLKNITERYVEHALAIAQCVVVARL